MDNIGEQLAALRHKANLTQDGLADRAGISVTVVRKIEYGGTARIESYHSLARALGVRTMMFVPAGLEPENSPTDVNPLGDAPMTPESSHGRLLGDVTLDAATRRTAVQSRRGHAGQPSGRGRALRVGEGASPPRACG